jgi:hypothetical protein
VELTAVPTPTPTTTVAIAPCVGDCDGDAEVTIDELLRMIAISLGDIDLAACPAGDRNGDGEITIDEVIAATYAALNACVADLVPASVELLPCPGGCGPQRIEVCVVNQGPLGAGPFDVAVNNQLAGAFSRLAAGAQACTEVGYRSGEIGGVAQVTIDPQNSVAEIREDDNTLSFPAPNPTACDLICEIPGPS